jgi:hypothetical protein
MDTRANLFDDDPSLGRDCETDDPPRADLFTLIPLPRIRAVIWRSISGYAISAGLEIEDVIQSVLAGLLSRQNGGGRWDPSRSSYTSYIWLVSRSVFSTLYQRHLHRTSREVSVGEYSDSDWFHVPSHSENPPEDTQAVRKVAERFLDWAWSAGRITQHDLSYLSQILPLVASGRTDAEIAAELGLRRPSVTGWRELSQRLWLGWGESRSAGISSPPKRRRKQGHGQS